MKKKTKKVVARKKIRIHCLRTNEDTFKKRKLAIGVEAKTIKINN